jgi:hypothetical protein
VCETRKLSKPEKQMKPIHYATALAIALGGGISAAQAMPASSGISPPALTATPVATKKRMKSTRMRHRTSSRSHPGTEGTPGNGNPAKTTGSQE